MCKTAIYVRTGNPTQDSNMDQQIAKCMEHAGNADVEIYREYGPGLDVYRPELFRMMKNIRDGKIQRVIVKDCARLSRNFMHLTELIREMSGCGCTILSVADGIDTGISYDGSEELRRMISVWDRRQRMHEMEDSGQYRFYGEKIDDIPDDQVVEKFMTMMNFLPEIGNA